MNQVTLAGSAAIPEAQHSIPPSGKQAMDEALDALVAKKDAWLDVSIRDRIRLLDELSDALVAHADAWIGVALEAKLAGPAGTIACDRGRVLQVLGNLLGNALKFTPEGGRVVVTTTDAGAAVCFEVEDTGPGIKPADLPNVFGRYWKGAAGGTGLGLFIAQSIVRGHGGRIEVESRPGLGARFSFTIPRALSTGG